MSRQEACLLCSYLENSLLLARCLDHATTFSDAQGHGLFDVDVLSSLVCLDCRFLSNQAEPELNKKIIALEADLDQIFNTHRSKVGDKTLTENDVRKILKETFETKLARQAWSGYIKVGRKVEQELRQLVKLRNQVARQLGYENYFSMRLEIQEFDEAKLFQLFYELDELTSDPFTRLKKEIDRRAAERFGLTEEKFRPWHTSDLFFHEAPDLSEVLAGVRPGEDSPAPRRTSPCFSSSASHVGTWHSSSKSSDCFCFLRL